MRQALRIGVADTDEGYREDVRRAVRRAGGELVAEASTTAGLVAAAAGEELDVVLVGERLWQEGVALPGRVAVVVAAPTLAGFRAAVAGGATGYLPRRIEEDELVRCLEDVAVGVIAAPGGLMTALILGVVEGRDAGRGPTRRQGQVAALAANGLSTAQIAGTLGVTEAAVRRHRSELASRLGSDVAA